MRQSSNGPMAEALGCILLRHVRVYKIACPGYWLDSTRSGKKIDSMGSPRINFYGSGSNSENMGLADCLKVEAPQGRRLPILTCGGIQTLVIAQSRQKLR